MNETIKTLTTRRSVRSYSTKPVPQEILDEILEAGKYAPSGLNKQSAVMVVVDDNDRISSLSMMNAAVMGATTDPFYGAGTIIVVFADSTVPTYMEDGALVMGNLMNAAHSLGVDSCWVHRAREMYETVDGKALKQRWGLDDKYVGIGHCVLGYADKPVPEAAPRRTGRVIYDD